MRIYVAGEVPRGDHTPSALQAMVDELTGKLSKKFSSEPLTRIYRRIEEAASGMNIELVIPHPNPAIDKLDPKTFVQYLRDEIGKSDAVMTIFFPPGIAVGFEAHLASELGKPQTILIPRSLRVPRYLHALPSVIRIGKIEDIQLREVLVELMSAVQESA